MPRLTKGTHIYFIDPEAAVGEEIVRIKGATAFNPGSAPPENVETTDLEETDTRSYMKGLKNPGSGSMTIMADPTEPSHIRLHELSEQGDSPKLKFACGWSDGSAPPTLDTNGDGFEFPDTRSFNEFIASVDDFPLDFQLNTTVQTQLSLQRSGGMSWTPKTP